MATVLPRLQRCKGVYFHFKTAILFQKQQAIQPELVGGSEKSRPSHRNGTLYSEKRPRAGSPPPVRGPPRPRQRRR